MVPSRWVPRPCRAGRWRERLSSGVADAPPGGEVLAATASGSRAHGRGRAASAPTIATATGVWQRTLAAGRRRQWRRRYTRVRRPPHGARLLCGSIAFAPTLFFLFFFWPMQAPTRQRSSAAAAWSRCPPPGGAAQTTIASHWPAVCQGPPRITPCRDAWAQVQLTTLACPPSSIPPPPPFAVPRTPRASQDGAALGRRLTPHCSSARWCCGGTAHPSTPAAARPSRGAAPAPRRSPTTRPSRGARPTPR